jgi:flavodoxin
MKILNLYYSQTGNTEKIANRISLALKNSGHEITMIEAEKTLRIDLTSKTCTAKQSLQSQQLRFAGKRTTCIRKVPI